MNTRNGTLSPVSTSTDSQEWSPITRYTNLTNDNPYSPTLPPSTYGGSQYGGPSSTETPAGETARPLDEGKR